MSDSTSLDQLKHLVGQLQAKIERLENQAAAAAGDAKHKLQDAAEGAKEAVKGAVGGAKAELTPAQHLRLVLMGPPGAGASLFPLYLSVFAEAEEGGGADSALEGRLIL
jgi:adenylate kinase